MLRRSLPFLYGMLVGLFSTGLLLLVTSPPRGYPVTLVDPPTPGPVRVHVAGAVARPGVYELPRGAIVQEAIDAAGGPHEGALLDSLNLAVAISDGQKIYLPWKPSNAAESGSAETDVFSSLSQDGLINPNTASPAELDTLPGIGPALAKSIVDFRNTHGPFASLDDLLLVPGIGPAKLESLRDHVTLP
jgi:competence protein ComEA